MKTAPVYFADAAFWIALSHKSDEYHARAFAWSMHLIRSDALILTTEAVLWEWMNALAAAGSRRMIAEGYRRCHHDPHVEVVPFAADTLAAAVRFYDAKGDKDWSLTDCFSFLTMGQRRISRALTTDRRFLQAGFEPVLLGDPPLAD